MTINPLQPFAPTAAPDQRSPGKRKAGPSPFDALLDSAAHTGAGSTVKARQAAAELLRMEMMHSSLSLSGDPEAGEPTGVKALESLLCGIAGGKGYHSGEKGETAASDKSSGGVAAGAGTEGIGDTAAGFLGTPYRFGGEGSNGIDCSSFVQQVFREHRIDLPRTAREQSQVGSDVPPGELKKGDLIFFHTYASYPSHVGIYLGDGKMIHASSAKGEVTVSDINSDYYRSRFLGAKRVA